MNKVDLERLEKWKVLMLLMGIEEEQLAAEDDDPDFFVAASLYEYLEWTKKLANPDPILTAAIRTHEMGISLEDIENYEVHNLKIKEAQDKAAAQAAIDNAPAIVELRNNRNFIFIEGKQYKHHTHWQFTMPGGLEVKGRTFASSWDKIRCWLYYKDKDNKLVKQMTEFDKYRFLWPKGMPHVWSKLTTIKPETIAYCVAWWAVNKRMPPWSNLRVPKK